MKASDGWAATVVVALMLSACGGSADDAAAPAAEESGNHALLDAAEEPLERARAVEDISEGRKAQLDQEIEDAGR